MQGLTADDYVEIKFNINMPMDNDKMYSNLKKMREMGAISVQSVMDNSEYVAANEKERLENEGYIDQTSADGLAQYSDIVGRAESVATVPKDGDGDGIRNEFEHEA
jgi:hypothetical protein